MAKSYDEKISEAKEKISQYENQLKGILQKQRAQERKDRTRRLCERGGLLESLLPDTIALTKENFKSFLEKTAANDYGRRTLAALTAEQEKQTAAIGTDANPQDGENPADTPPKLTAPSNATTDGKPAGAAHSSGTAGATATQNGAGATG